MPHNKKWNYMDSYRMMSGGVAGSCSQMACHPIDTIKVRRQLCIDNLSSLRITANMYKYEGIKSFFRGSTWPIIMRMGVSSIFYSLNGFIRSQEEKRMASKNTKGTSTNHVVLPLYKVFSIAAVSGLLVSSFVSPIELIKIQLQNDKCAQHPSQLSVFKQLMRTNKLWTGFMSTALRTAPEYGSYLLVYEWWNRLFDKHAVLGKNKVFQVLGSAQVISGSILSGITCWIVICPLDYIKTQIQSQPINASHKLNIYNIIHYTWKTYGVRGFFRGMAPCLMRSIPYHAVNLWSYESTLQMLQMHSFTD